MSSQLFEKSCVVPVPARMLFDWHAMPAAFDRLCPPWENVELLEHTGIREGGTARIRMKIGPLSQLWIAEHQNYIDGVSFQDVQLKGPFAEWKHTHTITSVDRRNARLTDSIRYRIPGGWLGQRVAGRMIRRSLERMFAYRHRRTRDDLIFQNAHQEVRPMKIAITGGTGMIGQELKSLLTTGGHEVRILTRSAPSNQSQVQWDPDAEEFDPAWFADCDAVVHLAGENIAGKRWNDKFKKRLVESRVPVTVKLVAALGKLERRPQTLISASAIGWYGDRGDELLTNQSPVGDGFLPNLCQDWEAASHPAREMGIRVVNPRIGVVLSPKGGALKTMLTPFKLGVGGVLGSGKQYMSWIGLDDVAAAIAHAIFDGSVEGPMNCVAPHPVTNREFTKTLGRILSRPTIFPIPAFGAKLAFGEMAEALLLASARIEPIVLSETAYEFRNPELEGCLRHVLGR